MDYGHEMELWETQFETELRRQYWAVVLGLKPVQDGDQYCILWGDNLQEGVAGFGPTPFDAIKAFEQAMYDKTTSPEKPEGKEKS